MDKKKIAIGILGLGGIAALAYYLYQRSKGSALPANTTADIPANASPAYEGKAYKMGDKTYLVRNGVLRHLANPAVRARELGSNDWDVIVKSGVGSNVTTLPPLPIGPQLTGLTSVLV